MRKPLLSLFILFSFGLLAFGQTTYVDYEGKDMPFMGWGGSTFEMVSNPNASGINTSDNVGKFVKGGNTWEWAGLYSDPMGGTFDFSSSSVFTVKVLSDTAGPFLFKLEKWDDSGVAVETTVDYTTPGEWQELSFDLSAGTTETYGKIVLIPDLGNDGTGGHIWWFDDISGPAFIAGGDVEVTFKVTDIFNATTSVEVEVSSDPGNKIALTNDGAGVWTAVQTIPGNTYETTYTYTVYVDGEAREDATDKSTGVAAGSGTATVAYTFGGGLTDEAVASYFGNNWPDIDGEIDTLWNSATQYQVALPFATESFENNDDVNGYFKVGWDESGLYVLVEVNDDYFYAEGDHGEAWEMDKIEVYIDMNVDDLQDGAGPSVNDNNGSSGHYQLAPGNFVDWEGSPSWFATGDRAWVSTSTTEGEAYKAITEFYIPWDAIPDKDGNVLVPDNFVTIGFDVTMNDNDGENNDNTNIRNRMVWGNTVNPESWSNMDNCGSLMFEEAVSVKDYSKSNISVYPNPVNDVLYITNAEQASSVTIHNILGAEVISMSTEGGNIISVPTTELTRGVYILTVKGHNGIITNEKFIVE